MWTKWIDFSHLYRFPPLNYFYIKKETHISTIIQDLGSLAYPKKQEENKFLIWESPGQQINSSQDTRYLKTKLAVQSFSVILGDERNTSVLELYHIYLKLIEPKLLSLCAHNIFHFLTIKSQWSQKQQQ